MNQSTGAMSRRSLHRSTRRSKRRCGPKQTPVSAPRTAISDRQAVRICVSAGQSIRSVCSNAKLFTVIYLMHVYSVAHISLRAIISPDVFDGSPSIIDRTHKNECYAQATDLISTDSSICLCVCVLCLHERTTTPASDAHTPARLSHVLPPQPTATCATRTAICRATTSTAKRTVSARCR